MFSRVVAKWRQSRKRKEPVVKQDITWVGLDAHKQFIQVAVLVPGRSGFSEWRVDRPDKAAAARLAKKLVALAPGEVRCCYEAGPCGYWLKRQMEASAPLVCEVIAPSLIPVKPGERIKTDRRDARKLAKYLEAGQLVEVHPPTEEEESVRDLCRLRDDARQDLMRCRHRLSKWSLRRGLRFPGKSKNWSQGHITWLRGLTLADPVAQAVLDKHLTAIEETKHRLDDLTSLVEVTAETDGYREPVSWLRAFHGIDTLTAMSIVAELHDFRRFESPRALMAYLGLVPSEHSSGGKRRGGSITKAGNTHVRRLLIEAAWHYRRRVHVSRVLLKRREGVPDEVVAVAKKAHHRLSRRHYRLRERGIPPSKVNTAVARELAGFIWAALSMQRAA